MNAGTPKRFPFNASALRYCVYGPDCAFAAAAPVGGSLSAAQDQALQASLGETTTAPGITTGLSGTEAANRVLGQFMAAGYGWATGTNWQALDHGWGTLESGWNNQVYNGGQTGGPYQPGRAYGIPQANGHGPGGAPYPAGNAGNPPGAGGSSSAASQIAWGLAYIRGTYGSPRITADLTGC